MRGNSFLSNSGNNGRAYMGRWDYLPWGFGGWFENMYKYCYGAIDHANYVIDHVSTMRDNTQNEEVKKKMQVVIAECKLMRALIYFRLISWWGDVPYIDWNVKSNAEVASMPRTPISEIYANLLLILTRLSRFFLLRQGYRGVTASQLLSHLEVRLICIGQAGTTMVGQSWTHSRQVKLRRSVLIRQLVRISVRLSTISTLISTVVVSLVYAMVLQRCGQGYKDQWRRHDR